MTSFAAAPALPDLLKPRRQRKGWTGFLLNNPTITFGAGLLLVMFKDMARLLLLSIRSQLLIV